MKKSVLSIFFLAIVFVIFLSFSVSAGDGFGGKGLEDRLAAQYKFDNGNSFDFSLREKHAAAQGDPQPTTDRFGISNGAVELDGTGDYFTIDDSFFSTTQALTVTGWYHFNGDISGNNRLVTREAGGVENDFPWRLFNAGGIIYMQIKYADSTIQTVHADLRAVAGDYDNEWIFIAATYNKTSLKLYVDRAQDASFGIITPSLTQVKTTSSTKSLKIVPGGPGTGTGIGGRAYDGAALFIGSIDDVRIYERSLSQNEIEALYLEKDIDDSLVMHFKLDEEAVGGKVSDVTGNYQGTIQGNPSFVPIGRDNGAYHFDDGTNPQSSIIVEGSEIIGTLNEITVATWVKLDVGTQNSWQHIVTKRRGNDAEIDWTLQTSAPTDMFSFSIATVDNLYHARGSIIRTGTWQHIVGTYDGNKLKIYVNGRLEDSVSANGFIKNQDQVPVIIGARRSDLGGGVDFAMNGSADDVRIYNKALNPAEVWDLYRNTPLKYSNFPETISGHQNPGGEFIPRNAYVSTNNETLGRTTIVDTNTRAVTTDGISWTTGNNFNGVNGWPDYINMTAIYSHQIDEVNSLNPIHFPEEESGVSFWLMNAVGLGEFWTVPVPPGNAPAKANYYPPEATGVNAFNGIDLPGNEEDVAVTGYYQGFGETWIQVYTDGPVLGQSKFSYRADVQMNTPPVPPRIEPGTWTYKDISTMTNNHPDQIPSSIYYYRISNCPYMSSIIDVNLNGVIGECAYGSNGCDVGFPSLVRPGSDGWIINTSKADIKSAYGGIYEKYYNCADLNGDEVVDIRDKEIMWNFQNSSLATGTKTGRIGSRVDTFKDDWPLNSEVHAWFTNSLGGGELRLWNGSGLSDWTNYTFDISGLPLTEGPPTLGYYDDTVKRIIVWYGDSSYESADGRNFRLFHGTGPPCSSDSMCSGNNYCDVSTGQCTAYSCIAGSTCSPPIITNICIPVPPPPPVTLPRLQTQTTTDICTSQGSEQDNACVTSDSFEQTICNFGCNILPGDAECALGTYICVSGQDIGDTDGTGIINSADAEIVIQIEAGLIPLPADICCGDVDEDGDIDSTDALWITQIEAGTRPPVGICGAGIDCGNNILDSGETCDDGNVISGDGCDEFCQIEIPGPECGDGIKTITNDPSTNEECDDGNQDNGDGCDTFGTAPNSNGMCTLTFCGDGVFQNPNGDLSGIGNGNEQCDDGNTNDGDGCSSTCVANLNEFFCGDGIITTGPNNNFEECDNSAQNPLGGNTCLTVPGGFDGGVLGCDTSCDYDTTACTSGGVVCGDGHVESGENCDDGNLVNGDGCDSSCVIESGWRCLDQSPSICYPIPLGLCGNLDSIQCENSTFWSFELLQAIETTHEAFAEANDLDFDFCTNNQSDDAECGCAWFGVTTGCVEFVIFDDEGDGDFTDDVQCFVTYGNLNEVDCSSGVSEYTINWFADAGSPGSAVQDASIGCVDGSESFQCPVRVKLPFFTLINMLISLLFIAIIYFVIRKDFE